jgi:uncharacterized delta-60 repeat protein
MLLRKSKNRRTSTFSLRTGTRRACGFESLEERCALAAGSLDPTFGIGGIVTTDFLGQDESHSVAVQPDGKIIAAGRTTNHIAIARYHADGTLDTTFGDAGRVTINGPGNAVAALRVAIQADGKIVVAGNATAIPFADSDFAVARLLSDGSLDLSFGNGGLTTIDFGTGSDDFATDFALQPDGKAIVVGLSVDGSGQHFVATRLNSDGTLDSSFGSGGKQTVEFAPSSTGFARSVALQPDGKIVVGGPISDPATITPDDSSDFGLARLNSDGQLDTTFGSGGKVTVDSGSTDGWSHVNLAIQRDRKILLVGTSGNGNSDSGGHLDMAVVRMDEQGILDGALGNGGIKLLSFGGERSHPTGVAIQPDGRLIISGWSESGDTSVTLVVTRDIALARLTPDGNFDPAFDEDGIQFIDFSAFDQQWAFGSTVQADGRIIVAGRSSFSDFAVARIDAYDFSVVGTPANDLITVSPGTQAGTLKIGVNGTVTDNIAVTGEVFVAGIGGSDSFTVTASLSGGLILAGQGDADTYDISLGNLAGKVIVADDGAVGTDHLIVWGTAGNDEIFKDATKVTLGNPVIETVLSVGIETRDIHGGGGDDLITDPGSDTTLFGDEGNDTIVINATFGSGVTADGGEGSDSYQIIAGELDGPIAIADSGTTGTDSVTIVGTAGHDTLTQTSTGLVLNGTTITLDSTVETATVDGGGGTDQVSTEGTPPVPISFLDMLVNGTSGNDHIVINLGTLPGEIVAKVNGQVVAQFSPTRRIVIFAGDGNDDIQVAGDATLPVWAYGEGGDDRIKGGAGHDLLLGGEGNDLLIGGNGRDLLIGGNGADRIVGNADDDILIAGYTLFDSDQTALSAIMAEWTSTRDYAARTANITGIGSGPTFDARENATYYLTTEGSAPTVRDDSAKDTMTGSDGQDWFFANLAEGVLDKITDLSADEFAADLDFILS